MNEITLTIKAHVIHKPVDTKFDFVADYRRMYKKDGTYLGERDLGDCVVLYVAPSHHVVETIQYVSRGLAADLRCTK